MKKKYIILLLFSSVCFFGNDKKLSAQDLHFSQYSQTPSLINPALTGGLSVLRASVIYKDQWKSVTTPYKTFGASLETRIHKKKGNLPTTVKSSFDRFAIGISFFSDKAGDGNMGLSMANLSLATFVPTGEKSALSLGLQASVVQQKVDFSKLIFPDQYTGVGYDASLSNGENSSAQVFTYPDFAAGVNWSYGYNKRKAKEEADLKANIGASIYHGNQPKQSFLGKDDRLNPKVIVHADMLIGMGGSNIALVPSYICTFQGVNREMMEGLMIKYYFVEGPKYYGSTASSDIGIGITYRNKDAAILSALLEYGQYAIGCSYDLNISLLNSVSKVKGGPEVFLRFVTPNPFLGKKRHRRRYHL